MKVHEFIAYLKELPQDADLQVSLGVYKDRSQTKESFIKTLTKEPNYPVKVENKNKVNISIGGVDINTLQ